MQIASIFTIFSFQNSQKRRGPLLIANSILEWLCWQFWIVNNPLGKNLTTIFFLDYLKLPIMYGDSNTPVVGESIIIEFHISASFTPFGRIFSKKLNLFVYDEV